MAGVRKQQVTVSTGDVRLVRDAGRYLLMQGDTAIDVTRVMGMVNYPLGTVSLRLRVSNAGRMSVRDATADAEPESAAV